MHVLDKWCNLGQDCVYCFDVNLRLFEVLVNMIMGKCMVLMRNTRIIPNYFSEIFLLFFFNMTRSLPVRKWCRRLWKAVSLTFRIYVRIRI